MFEYEDEIDPSAGEGGAADVGAAAEPVVASTPNTSGGEGPSFEPTSSGPTGDAIAAAAARAADGQPSPHIDPVDAQQSAFPMATDYGWDDWDGKDHSGFDERLSPWLQSAGDRIRKQLVAEHEEALRTRIAEATSESDRQVEIYRALWSEGGEDPRIKEYQTASEQKAAAYTALEAKYKAQQTEMQEQASEENERYFVWFEKTYKSDIQTEGGQKAIKACVPYMEESRFEAHELFEAALVGGEDLLKQMQELDATGSSMKLVREVTNARISAIKAAAPPKIAPSASARLVADGASAGGGNPPPKTPPPRSSLSLDAIADVARRLAGEG